MSEVMKFSDLTDPQPAQKDSDIDKAKKGLSVEIEVAGAKKTEKKTVQIKLDNRGLMQLSFAEGGQMPEVLSGRFTSLDEVKLALTIWKDRRDAEFNLDEKVKVPHASKEESVAEVVDKAAKKSSPKFASEKTGSKDKKGFVDLSDDEG